MGHLDFDISFESYTMEESQGESPWIQTKIWEPPKKTGLNMVQYPKNQFGSLSSGSSIYIYI